MGMGPRLDLRQSQSLVMTPQLQQAIRLLALSNLEVEAFIAEEIEKNPLLEGGTGDEVPDAPEETAAAPDAEAMPETTIETPTTDDADWSEERFEAASSSDGGSASPSSDEGIDFDSFAAASDTLAEHLMHQAGEVLGGRDLAIAAQIVDAIDDSGYLTVSIADLADRMGLARAAIEAVLAIVQTFDPVGVGARTLAECLMLQAKDADRYDPCMAILIDNLDLLATGRIDALQRRCGVDDEDMADMIRELRGYDPKPGLRFGSAPVEAVTPDLFVTETKKGWRVEINGATLPRVLIDRKYHAELAAGANDKASKLWLGDCLASANWLVKALDQRQRTIVRVATEIVKAQDGFFRHGVSHLRPLTLRMIAEAVQLHESTVSRVTSNKYLACARGTFELKYFFTSAIQAVEGGGEAASALAVKAAIKTLIAAEAADAILSDDTLVDLLREKGFDIARRTVAKYREALGLGSSVQRRRARAIDTKAA
jgi:RNA polymerase sigma-54 factor